MPIFIIQFNSILILQALDPELQLFCGGEGKLEFFFLYTPPV